MANDRSIITWETVLKAKEKYEIKNMLIINYKAIYGADIEINAATMDAGLIDALTDILYDFSILANDVYNSFDIANAKGALLDNLVLLSGNLKRFKPSKTKIKCKLTFNGDSIPYSYGTDNLVALDTENKIWYVYPVVTTQTEIYPDALYEGEEQLVYLEHQYEGEFLLPDGANPIQEIRLNGAFETNNTIALNDIILIERGTFAETDSQLKARKKDSLSYNSTSLIDSIKESVLSNIFSIDDIKIYNSVGGTPLNISLWNGTALVSGGVTIPLHDIFVLVKPQEGVVIEEGQSISTALVNILQKKITLGISTYQSNIDTNYHSLTIPVNSKYDTYTETYRYYVAQPFKPTITINYTPVEGSGFIPSTMKQRVKEAVYNIAKDYGINKNINKSEIAKIISSAANIDETNPTCVIDSVVFSSTEVNNGYWYVNLADELEISSSNLIVGETYEIADLGNTDWNIVFGTVGVTYETGDSGVVVSIDDGTGTALISDHKISFSDIS